MELELASPNEKEKMQMRQYQAQAAPLAQQEKGVVGQMGDMAKQRAMEGALDKGQSALMGAIPSAGAAKAAMLSSTPATMGMGGAEVALAGQTLAPTAGAGMAALGTAVPYVGAGLLAGKALGLFNEGGMVGPLSLQYRAEGTMTPEQAKALMMNQPEPQAPPMINPDQLYNEIVAESMTEAAQGQIPPTPTMRPPLMVDPLGADTTYSPYNMMRPDNVPST
jgi:hypothetical protein